MNTTKLIKVALFITYIFMGILLVLTVALPWLVTWYVEVMGRAESLPATVMVTCYPCIPFSFGILIFFKRILKNSLKDEFFSENTILQLKRISFCSLIIALITVIAGKFYMPFYIVGVTFGFLSYIVYVFVSILKRELEKNN